MDEMVDRLLDILADKLTERLSAGHKELYTAKELAERYGVSCATISMKYGRSLQELAIELDRQAKVKKDYVATAGAMQMTAVNENFDLVIGNTPFQLNENAHRQLGLQLKIPAPYYERMRAENPGLLMANVNGWFQQSPDTRRMVRTLDGTARAILSDRYRRIDNYEVAQTVLPIISEMQGARIESCELTDTTKMQMRAAPSLLR